MRPYFWQLELAWLPRPTLKIQSGGQTWAMYFFKCCDDKQPMLSFPERRMKRKNRIHYFNLARHGRMSKKSRFEGVHCGYQVKKRLRHNMQHLMLKGQHMVKNSQCII
jgi:hypothetical protein